jgi:hypothetical protein
MTEHPIVDQPPPVHTNGPAIVDLVLTDLAERKRIGIARYGTPLQAHNGRDALIDAYQEALDLACYLRQAIEERTAERDQHHDELCEAQAEAQAALAELHAE